jgi:hypothetical protein
MKWEEDRMKILLEEEQKRKKDERQHDIQMLSMIGELFKQSTSKNLAGAPSDAQSSTYNGNFYKF